MSSSFGKKVNVTIFGQSHSSGIGVVIDGLPVGEKIDLEQIQAFMNRRAPGNNAFSTPRKETDQPRILSGLFEGKTCGAPMCAVIENRDVKSNDYDQLKDLPRPGHADYTAFVKYHGAGDHRGGGHFSGRLTAPLCFAGAVCLQILERRGITIGAHILSIHHIEEDCFDPVRVTSAQLKAVTQKEFPVIDDAAGIRMRDAIEASKREEDSLGGVIECVALGVPVGLGEPMFDGLENRLAGAIFAIPAVKGIEFGAGFQTAKLKGSENNDPFVRVTDDYVLITETNHHGGILGGISSGMPIILRAAFKPTPSIGKSQQSIRLSKNHVEALKVKGRHDPCIVPRAVPCVEAAVAIQILDLMEIR